MPTPFVEVNLVEPAAQYAPQEPIGTQAEAFRVEQQRMRERRQRLGVSQDRNPNHAVGLALSGGGLRSATFSLGILRALAEKGLIPSIDYLSTVSGGSYIGAFLCSRYVPQAWRGDIEQSLDLTVEGGTGDPFEGNAAAQAFEHLRQSGRYLIPGSTGEAIKLITIMSRNWLAVQFVLGLTFLALFLLLKPVQHDLVGWRALQEMESEWATRGLSPMLWPSNWLQGYQIGHWFIASPFFIAAFFDLLLVIGAYWAYFLPRGYNMPTGRLRRFFGLSLGMALAVLAAGAALVYYRDWLGAGLPKAPSFGVLLVIVSIIAIALYAGAEFWDWLKQETNARADSPRVQEDRVRASITNVASRLVGWLVMLSCLGLIDSLAQTIYARWTEFGLSLSAGALIVAAIPGVHQLLIKLPALFTTENQLVTIVRRFGRLLALLSGVLLLFIIALFWAVIAHAIAWRGGPIASFDGWRTDGAASLHHKEAALWVITMVLVGVALAIGWSFAFLNLSTYATFYATRLRRAYLGASNRDRYSGDVPVPFEKDEINDDIALERYYHPAVLAPLHLINVTINDTASAASSTTQRDRRGKPLTISPAGFLYPAESTLKPVSVLPHGQGRGGPERLPLSNWIALSGAAASTGMGQYGSIGLSLLAGLSNLRLGHWWSPGRRYRGSEKFWNNLVQFRLADELQGRFPGSDGKRWYLTDGGHFENTGAYELVRRRVAFIILCDNGADPKYEFSDFVTLARRIKIDFDAELSFLTDAELDSAVGVRTALRQAFGSFEALAEETPTRKKGPYAAIARIRYNRPARDGEYEIQSSTLVLVKPRVCGCEPPDLSAYKELDPAFPQQSTLDQDFDEAQWESYYGLGLLIGGVVFARPEDYFGEPWSASSFVPLP